VQSINACEVRETLLEHREAVLAAELSRLNGEPIYTVEEARTRLKEKYVHVKV